jgi:hypothetical protein
MACSLASTLGPAGDVVPLITAVAEGSNVLPVWTHTSALCCRTLRTHRTHKMVDAWHIHMRHFWQQKEHMLLAWGCRSSVRTQHYPTAPNE